MLRAYLPMGFFVGEVTLGYLRLFTRGVVMVSLVASNTYQVAHSHLWGAAIIGFLISYVWFHNARTAARTDLAHAGVVYALGAAVGTLIGVAVMTAFWGGK